MKEIGHYNSWPKYIRECNQEDFFNFLINECSAPVCYKQITEQNKKLGMTNPMYTMKIFGFQHDDSKTQKDFK